MVYVVLIFLFALFVVAALLLVGVLGWTSRNPEAPGPADSRDESRGV